MSPPVSDPSPLDTRPESWLKFENRARLPAWRSQLLSGRLDQGPRSLVGTRRCHQGRIAAGAKLAKGKKIKVEQPLAVRARQKAIGLELKRLYDSVLQEPVPDEFLDLLKKMDAQKTETDGNGST
jgi:hypothetical protein